MHDLFEHLDFSLRDEAAVRALVKDKLKAHGIAPAWEQVIYDMLEKVMHVRLSCDDSSVTLSALNPLDRIHEMSFYFPIRSIDPSDLRRLFEASDTTAIPDGFPQQIENITFAPSKGFMKGYIDLVFQHHKRFYILDWKSNYLGPHIENYDQAGILQNMQHSYYMLQYLLYTLALHRFLQVRVPGYRYDSHFGGIFYIYCRGVDPQSGSQYGIYADRPEAALIETLAEMFMPSCELRSSHVE